MRNGAPSRDVVSRSLHPQLRRATKPARRSTVGCQGRRVLACYVSSLLSAPAFKSRFCHQRMMK